MLEIDGKSTSHHSKSGSSTVTQYYLKKRNSEGLEYSSFCKKYMVYSGTNP